MIDMVVWELTLRCNLSCHHCGSRAGHGRSNELTTDEALDVVKQLAMLPTREVALIGGEAYLRPDWDIVARAITDHGMHASMVTGGRQLDAATARRARDAGVVNISLSIDGLQATHDRQRGVRGSYDAALRALGHLADAGVATSVNTQINRLSSPELEQLFGVVRDHRVWAWRVNLTVAMGRAADHPEWLLQPYELLELFPRLAALKHACTANNIVFAPGNNIGYFGPYEQLFRGGRTGGAHWQGCQAGARTLGLEADGTLKGCPSLPTTAYAGGNIRDRSVVELLKQPAVSHINARTADDLWGYCQSCYYANVCRAGCTWTSHVLFGRSGNNPYCHYRALELEKRGLRERLIPVVAAPGVPFDHGRFQLVVESHPQMEVADGAV